jgi:glycerol-3-phosphate dehydrogenase
MYGAPADLCAHLVSLYGRRAARVLEIAKETPAGRRTLSPHSLDIAAQAVLAAREEWARTPEDAILRRMHLGITRNRGKEAVPEVERILA